MSSLSVDEFKSILYNCDYSIDSDDLRELVSRLTTDATDEPNRYQPLWGLLRKLKKRNFQADFRDNDTIIDIYLGFSGLQFSISESGKLILVEQMGYACKCMWTDKTIIEIGEPTIDNVIKIIDLYQEQGKIDPTSPFASIK